MIGTFKNQGNDVSQSIVTSGFYLIIRLAIRSLRTSELHSETEERKRRIFDNIILKKLGRSVTVPTSPKAQNYAPYFDCVEPCSAQLPEDNDPFMIDGATI